jgi:hypothetical protein
LQIQELELASQLGSPSLLLLIQCCSFCTKDRQTFPPAYRYAYAHYFAKNIFIAIFGKLSTCSPMADAGAERAVVAAFPPPPPFWKHFTSDNLNKLEHVKEEQSTPESGSRRVRKWSPADLQSLNIPAELRYLIPPAIPKSGSYSVFGESQSVS